MRKEYDFSDAGRSPYATRVRRRALARSLARRRADDLPPHTPAQIRRIRRDLVDLRDRTRYILVSSFGPRFTLYYQLASDTYVMNEPAGATIFKRRHAALAIKRLLGKGIQIVPCRVDRRGRLVTKSVALPAKGPRRKRTGPPN